ncbi:E3 ubiquitin-protein ligase RZFP34-like isoform X2 [Wolffia australiana]
MEGYCGQVYDSMTNHDNLLDRGRGIFGCSHYRRRCKIRSPCCNEVFDCRHCHNEIKNSLAVDRKERHEIPRHELQKVICSLCEIEQDVQHYCESCGVCMGEYFCEKCKFFDDDVSKRQFHCEPCGICRTGGREEFFHCTGCGCCYSNSLRDSHRCIEKALQHNCPICFEYLFDSVKHISVPKCGHTLHLECLKEMQDHLSFVCPICSRSLCDMSGVWQMLDQEVADTPMPLMYQNRMIWILCNDCGANTEIRFHIVGNKCPNCGSYNTRQTRGGPSCASVR